MSLELRTVLVVMGLSLSGCWAPVEEQAETPPDGGFAVYLAAPGTSAAELSSIDLEAVELQDEPLIILDDIVTYIKSTHEIELTPRARERIQRLDVPITGLPFVVCVGSERVYGGAFWTMISSVAYDGIAVWVPLIDGEPMRMRPGYPAPSFFRGDDLRSDPRVLRSVQQSGKLR
jgi:hypothetical protein